MEEGTVDEVWELDWREGEGVQCSDRDSHVEEVSE